MSRCLTLLLYYDTISAMERDMQKLPEPPKDLQIEDRPSLLSTAKKIFIQEKQRFQEATTPEKMLPIYEAISKHLP